MLGKKLHQDIYNAMKDPGDKTGEELSRLYFGTLAKSLNEYLSANIQVIGSYQGVSTTTPPVPVNIPSVVFKVNFKIQGEIIRKEIVKAAEALKDSKGVYRYNKNLPNVFSMAIYKQLVSQMTNPNDVGNLVLIPPQPLIGVSMSKINLENGTSAEETNRLIAVGIRTMFDTAVPFTGGNGSGTSTTPPSTMGIVTFTRISMT